MTDVYDPAFETAMQNSTIHSANCLPSGTQLGPFQLSDVVGEGGFGIVYLARDTQLDRTVAIKEYMPSSLAGRSERRTVAVRPQHKSIFDAGLKSFINEARLLAKFSHPALVQVHQFFEQNDTAYMVMRYYEGITLSRMVTEKSVQISEERLAMWGKKLLDAIEVLHRAECFHRDIAPDNILIQPDGSPILLDFGAARKIIGDMAHAMTMVLKPGYAPIEQYADEGSMRQGAWTDVYQMAAVMYFAITGKTPSSSVSRMIEDTQPALASLTVAGFRPEFLAAIDHALALRPENRPQSIAEFRRLLGWEQESATPETGAERVSAPSSAAAKSNAAPPAPLPPTVPVLHPAPAPLESPEPQEPPEPLASPPHETIAPPEAGTNVSRRAPRYLAVGAVLAALGIAGTALAILGTTDAPPAGQTAAANERHEEASAWLHAKSIGTVDALTSFLAKHPEGPHAREARQSLAELAENPQAPLSQAAGRQQVAYAPPPANAPVVPEKAPAAQPAQPQNAPAETVAARENARPASKGLLKLQIAPWGRVFIDGSRRPVLSPPVSEIELAPGTHLVHIGNDSENTHRTSVDIKAGEATILAHQFEQTSERE